MDTNRVGEHAVVLGGSIAGLVTARVLSTAYRRVTVVDRDALRGVRTPRRGVPHGRHAHGLLARGHQILERLYPGLTSELMAAGVETGDMFEDCRWYFNGARLRPAHAGLRCVPATRPLLEYHIRLRTLAIPAITLMDRCGIAGVTATADRRRVTGVRLLPEDTELPRELEADLVVDATGRGSRLPVWLEELGYHRPPEDHVKIDLAYTTRHYQLRENVFGTDLGIIPVATPSHPRGAFFYPLPGDRTKAELSLTGLLGDHPPVDPDGFLDYVRSLPVPAIHDAIRDAEPLDDPVTFHFPRSVRRRYERLGRLPERLLAVGDATCSFNPVYGQGMTAAAMGAELLGEHLRRGGAPDPRRFFADLAQVLDAPWDIAAGSDLAYPEVAGRRTAKVRLINAYVSRLQRAAVHDADLGVAFFRAAGLIDPPQSMMRADRALRVLRGPRTPPPADRPLVTDGGARRRG